MQELSNTEREILGQRLGELRKAKNVSAAMVCEQALGHTSGSHVAFSRLERKLLPKVNPLHLSAFATYFGVSVDELFSQTSAAATAAEEIVIRDGADVPVSRAKKSSKAKLPLPKTLAERIRHLRDTRELSETEFAQALSRHNVLITTADVQAWEAGDKQPNALQFRALTVLCDTSESWLLNGVEAVIPFVRPAFVQFSTRAVLGSST